MPASQLREMNKKYLEVSIKNRSIF
ncbi:hypothetical protein BsWGS_00843 [Bradybaena similaris]